MNGKQIIQKGISLYEVLKTAHDENDLFCKGTPIILKYNFNKGKYLNSFFYMPEFDVIYSLFSNGIERISFTDNTKVANLEYKEKIGGIYIKTKGDKVIKRQMSSAIVLFSGNYAREEMTKPIYNTIEELLKY